MNYDDYNDDPEPGFFQRHRLAVVAGAVVLLVGGGFLISKIFNGASSPAPGRAPAMVMVKLPPPPPPPPPKPLPPQPRQEQPRQEETKMIEQPPLEAEPKPEEAPKDEPAPNVDLASAEAGPGDAGMTVAKGTSRGLGVAGGGTIGGGGKGGGRGGKWDRYAGQVIVQIKRALSENPKTSHAVLNLRIRIWPDATGRIERVTLAESTGDVALDTIIRNEVLSGLQLQEPPPKDMPMPIVLHVTALRPS